MALAVADDGLFARPDGLDRPADAALRQPPDGQRQRDLDRHILAAAERAADGRIDDAHLFNGQVERMGNRLAIHMRPLARDLHGDAAVLIEVRDARLRLEIGVFLHRRLVSILDYDIRRAESRVQVALTDAVAVRDVVGAMWMKLRRAGLHGLLRVQQQGQVLPFDADELERGPRLHLRLRDDECHLIADEAHDVRARLARPRAA